MCSFVVHDRCLKTVVSPCSSIAANLVKVRYFDIHYSLLHQLYSNVCSFISIAVDVLRMSISCNRLQPMEKSSLSLNLWPLRFHQYMFLDAFHPGQLPLNLNLYPNINDCRYFGTSCSLIIISDCLLSFLPVCTSAVQSML